MAERSTTSDDVSATETTIECRSCRNEMPIDANRCPHCGSRVITRLEAGGLAVVGLLLAVGTGAVGLWPLAALGAIAFLVGVLFYRNRSQKIQRGRA